MNSEIICPSCGLRNRAGANFCGRCGYSLRISPICNSCGALVDAAHRFCGKCGSRIAGAPAADASYSAGTAAGASQGLPSLRLPTRAFSDRMAAFGSRITPIAAPLLAAGALLVALAQVYLTLASEPGKDAPAIGIFALVMGFTLFALGAFGRSANSDSTDALYGLNIPGMGAAAGKMTPANVGALGVGFVAMATLAFRLLSGSESGWDMLLWLIAIGAFAMPFIPRPNVSGQFRMSMPRRYFADIVIVLVLVGVFVGLNTHDLTDWYYSAIGDEYAFYGLATDILESGVTRPFSQDGVYNHHPYLSSVYQAAVMWVFGEEHFWWKFSSVLSGALSIPGIYVLGYVLGGRKAAIVSAVLFSFSHYIFVHAHVGYNNLGSVPIAVWSIALFILGLRKGNASLLYAAGIIAGLGFYTHYSARSVVPILLIFGLTAFNPRDLLRLFPVVLGFAVAFLPTFLVEREAVFTRMFSQAAGGYSESVSGQFGERIFGNIKNNLFAFNYNPDVHTWASGALLDPVSAVLAVLGVALALGWLRFPFQRLLIIWFAVAITATGVLSPFPIVAITRLYFVLPALALLAGILVARFIDGTLLPARGASVDGLSGRAAPVIVLSALGAVILALNAWQFWVATPQVFHHTREAVAIGALRSEECVGNIEDVVIVGNATIPLLKPALESYHPDGMMPRLIDHEEVIAGESLPVESPRCVILMNPNDEDIQPFKRDLANRYQAGAFSVFANPSNTTSVEIFAPSGR